MGFVPRAFALERCLAYLFIWIGGFDGCRVADSVEEWFMFFGIFEYGAGGLGRIGARTGMLRHGWEAAVVSHGASRDTCC